MGGPLLTHEAWDDWLFSPERAASVEWLRRLVPRLTYYRGVGDDSWWIERPSVLPALTILHDLHRWRGVAMCAVVESPLARAIFTELRKLFTSHEYLRRGGGGECVTLARLTDYVFPVRTASAILLVLLQDAHEALGSPIHIPILVYPNPTHTPHHALAIPLLAPSTHVCITHRQGGQAPSLNLSHLYP